MKKRYLIIDGYNMIGQSSTLSTVAKENLEEAREQLLDTIANYNALIADEIVCVFDAYEQSGIEREYFYHGVKTIFTKEKETADSFIERYVYELYNKHTTHITVVTSDMSEQHAIFGSGAYRISSREMWRELKEMRLLLTSHLMILAKRNQELEFRYLMRYLKNLKRLDVAIRKRLILLCCDFR